MSKKIKDVTLLKFLGKGSYGTVYLSTKDGKPGYFATKQIERSIADKPSFYKYFENELRLLKDLHHPNIVHLEDVKKDHNYYYIVMEYVNGGSLTDCLKKYKIKYGKAFPEEIVQYLMRQIVDAIKYIHQRNIIHRDLKLDNIMVNFDNANDKNNLNMMRAKIKIIDFGFATKLTPDKNNLATTVLGSPINMDPLILNEMANRGKKINQLGYDQQSDIWSLGTICYELLIGQAVFDAQTMNDLVKKVESGGYSVPTSLSSEIVSFLNGMLQYNGKDRLDANALSVHPFLTKNVRDFSKIDTRKVSRKIDNKGLNINIKKNQTIWGIFNEEDEKKLIGINPKNLGPSPANVIKPIPEYQPNNMPNNMHIHGKTQKNIPRIHIDIPQNKNYNKTNSKNYPYQMPQHNIYGIPMTPDQPKYGRPQFPNMNMNNNFFPQMLPYPQNQQFQPGMGDFNPMFNYPTFAPSPMTFNRNFITNNRNIYSSQGYNSNQITNKQQFHGYTKINNYDDSEDLCSIQ